ncbi:SirB2 family protein [Porticoccus sp.]|nr:MAG: regulator SirB [Gammaproteobacteria bacterium]
MYPIIKNAHITFALISIALFLLRATWSVMESPKLQQKWVKIAPHVIDTLLLACAIYLMITLSQYPFAENWLTAKLLALFAYIGLGTFAIKRGKTAGSRMFFSLLSVATFCYIFAVAITHSPWPV